MYGEYGSPRGEVAESLTRHWWAVALRGAFAVVFGLIALIWPHITVLALVIIFGAYVLVDGVLRLAAAIQGPRAGVRDRRGWLAFSGVASIVLGVLTFVWPGVTALVLLWLIAAWALVTGVLEIAAAVRLRRVAGAWLLGVGGVLSVLFGILVAVWPAAGALAIIVLIGVYALVFGVALIMVGLRLRQMGRRAGVSGHAWPAAA
jgi:uncharacterized membrane protein HdeD (DUF308 family)